MRVNLRPRFDYEYKIALCNSRDLALDLGNNFVAIEHLFLGMLKVPNGKFSSWGDSNLSILESEILNIIIQKYPRQELYNSTDLHLTNSAENILVISLLECKLSKRREITTQDLLLAILHHNNDIRKLALRHGIKYSDIYQQFLINSGKFPGYVIYKEPLNKLEEIYTRLRLFYRLYLI